MTRIGPPLTFVVQDRHATVAIALNPDRNIHGLCSVLTVLKILLPGRIVHAATYRAFSIFQGAKLLHLKTQWTIRGEDLISLPG
jgi:hypothetical protein